MKYVALIRGINVGGNRTVAMADLRECFAHMGFHDVTTYINSGNVIFASETAPNTGRISARLEQEFGFPLEVLVLSQVKFTSVSRAIPGEWTNDTTQKSDVVFLFPDVDSPNILEKLGYQPAIETFIYMPGAVLMNISRANQQQGSLKKVVGTPLYRRLTIRNINTVRKLRELMERP